MKRLTRLAVPAVLAAFAVTACSSGDHLSEGKMADLMADLQLADAYAENNLEYRSDSARNVLRLAVLEKHGVTQEELDQSLRWYGHNLENYTKLYEEVGKRLDQRQKKLLASVSNDLQDAAGSMWPYSPMAYLSQLSSQDALTFSVPVSDLPRGERLKWMMRLSRDLPVQITIGVDYKEGGTSYMMRRNSGGRRLEISLQSDSARTVSRIYGIMRVDNRAMLPVWMDSISLTHQPLAKETYNMYMQQTDYRGPRKAGDAAPERGAMVDNPFDELQPGEPRHIEPGGKPIGVKPESKGAPEKAEPTRRPGGLRIAR